MDYYRVDFVGDCAVLTSDEFRETHEIRSDYRPNLVLAGRYFPCIATPVGRPLKPGERGAIGISAILAANAIGLVEPGEHFELREGPHAIVTGEVQSLTKVEKCSELSD